jgi:hypothetical protein
MVIIHDNPRAASSITINGDIRIMDITEALISLKPGAQWSLSGDTYEG